MYGLQKPHNGPQEPRLVLDNMSLPRLRVPFIVMDQGLKLCTRDLETPEKMGYEMRGMLREGSFGTEVSLLSFISCSYDSVV